MRQKKLRLFTAPPTPLSNAPPGLHTTLNTAEASSALVTIGRRHVDT